MSNPSDLNPIKGKIRDFIAANLLYSPDGFIYADDASFLQEGIIDSLGVMQLVEFVAKEFNLAVEQGEIVPENFDSVTRLAEFVQRRLTR